jgi:hypothetical protein
VLRLQDPRLDPAGRAITEALPRAIGLRAAQSGPNPATGLIYRTPPTALADLVRRIKSATGSAAVRLIGDPAMVVRGMALATETNRPNALAPLLAVGEVRRIGQGLEEPPAHSLARWLEGQVRVPVTWLRSDLALNEVI